MNRRMLLTGLVLTALAILTTLGTSTVTAQTHDCCDSIYVTVDDDVNCHVTLCLVTSAGRICQPFRPGLRYAFGYRCTHVDFLGVVLRDACGDTIRIRPDTCYEDILVAGHCCVDICIDRNDDGCPVVRITEGDGCTPCPLDPVLGDMTIDREMFVATKQD